jgi:hypothetical protein
MCFVAFWLTLVVAIAESIEVGNSWSLSLLEVSRMNRVESKQSQNQLNILLFLCR